MVKHPTLYVETHGNPSGPTIIFLHALGTSGWMWQRQTELLKNFHCLVPDLPGHGQSNHIPWKSFSETARLIGNLIQNRANAGKAHIVGLSLGAYVGLQLLSDSQSVTESALLSGLNVLPMPNRQVMDLITHLLAPFLKSNLIIKLNAKTLNIPETKLEEYRQTVQQMSIPTFIKANKEACNFAMPENITSVTIPTLLVAGSNEHPLIHESQQVLNRTMTAAQSYVVPNVGHGWNLEAPNFFATIVQDWIQQQPMPIYLQTVS